MIRFLEHVDMWSTTGGFEVDSGHSQMQLPWPSVASPGDVGLIISENAFEVLVLVGNETFSILRDIVDEKCERMN